MCGLGERKAHPYYAQVINQKRLSMQFITFDVVLSATNRLSVVMKKNNGWSVTSQEHKEVLIDLDFLYVKYGKAFTEKIQDALKRYGLT